VLLTGIQPRWEADAGIMNRLAVGLSVLFLVPGLAGSRVASAAPAHAGGTVQIRLTMTGGLHYRGTLSNAEDTLAGYLCRVVRQGSLVVYDVVFDGPALVDVASGRDKQTRKAFFSLMLTRYKPQITHYSGPDQDLLLAVQGHAYHHVTRPGIHSTLTATIATGGRGGSFRATQMSPYAGYPGAAVAVQGSWSCPTLH
jgi:hypothetical protein